jgi:hypothetical protein
MQAGLPCHLPTATADWAAISFLQLLLLPLPSSLSPLYPQQLPLSRFARRIPPRPNPRTGGKAREVRGLPPEVIRDTHAPLFGIRIPIPRYPFCFFFLSKLCYSHGPKRSVVWWHMRGIAWSCFALPGL